MKLVEKLLENLYATWRSKVVPAYLSTCDMVFPLPTEMFSTLSYQIMKTWALYESGSLMAPFAPKARSFCPGLSPEPRSLIPPHRLVQKFLPRGEEKNCAP